MGLSTLLDALRQSGEPEDTRNGAALALAAPVVVTYERPWERVLAWPERDANPFFHLVEAIWMLAGRNDVATLARFNKRMREYSDDGSTLHGAYGRRWRSHFGTDQLYAAIDTLRDNPQSRRAVLGMWDPLVDCLAPEDPAKDLPCNTHVYFRVRHGHLETTVMARSSDLIWGFCGANYVHFSMLHSWMASMLGVGEGMLNHFSNNLHIYPTHYPLMQKEASDNLMASDLYHGGCKPDRFPGDEGSPATALSAAESVLLGEPVASSHPWVDGTFRPMLEAHDAWRKGDVASAYEAARAVAAPDWRLAALAWIDRRVTKRKEGAKA